MYTEVSKLVIKDTEEAVKWLKQYKNGSGATENLKKHAMSAANLKYARWVSFIIPIGDWLVAAFCFSFTNNLFLVTE